MIYLVEVLADFMIVNWITPIIIIVFDVHILFFFILYFVLQDEENGEKVEKDNIKYLIAVYRCTTNR
jgi:hypothetical protein